MNLYPLFKRMAFCIDPEVIHDMSLKFAHHLPWSANLFSPIKPDDKFNLTINRLKWSFPVGLAAGFDKNAYAIKFFENLGFGAIEVGTITKVKQLGNLKPRIIRHPQTNSIQNSMGFPNLGSDQIFKNLVGTKTKTLSIGANIGKNKDTSESDTIREYVYLYKMFAPVSDYIVINISSPNTPGLRSFQKKEKLTPLLLAISEEKKLINKPVFVKISPDLTRDEVSLICELSKSLSLDGIIATNTTNQHSFGPGGLSGDYIKNISKEIRSIVCENLKEDKSQTIIGAGGISHYSELKEFWKMGGHFAQVYSALIYQGPELLEHFRHHISSDLHKHQFKDLTEMLQNISKT